MIKLAGESQKIHFRFSYAILENLRTRKSHWRMDEKFACANFRAISSVGLSERPSE